MVDLFDTDKTVNTIEIFQSDKFYLLNIWSSWCVPCREEHPILMELKK
jgi:cytochrome c biogenesis protein CcmG/thiol:disulfide interchange protein DsbE